jgi:hypothetical protein
MADLASQGAQLRDGLSVTEPRQSKPAPTRLLAHVISVRKRVRAQSRSLRDLRITESIGQRIELTPTRQPKDLDGQQCPARRALPLIETIPDKFAFPVSEVDCHGQGVRGHSG